MYLAYYKGRGTLLDRIIRLVTRSPFSHVEIIRSLPGDGETVMAYTSSSRDGGVVGRQIVLKPGHWELQWIPWTTGDEAIRFVKAHAGDGYDFLAILLTHLFGISRQSKNRWTCSELIGTAIGIERAWRLSPGDLHAVVGFAIRHAKPRR